MQPDLVTRLFRARTLFILSALFIVYATSIPWDLEHAPSLDHVQWIPLWDPERGRLHSIPDLVQNVVLFLPFGFFGVLAFERLKRGSAVLGTLVIAALGFLLSFAVEALQTMSVTRTPSASDLFTNTSGALFGAIGAFIYLRTMEARILRWIQATLVRQPGLLILLSYALAVTLGGLSPFIPTLDVGNLRASVRRLIDHPWGQKPIGALASDIVIFAALAFIATFELAPVLGLERFRASIAFISVSALGVLIEVAQLIIIGHSPSALDATVAVIAAAIGSAFAFAVSKGKPEPERKLGDLTRRWPWIVLGFAILAPAFRALQPFVLAPLDEKLAQISVWNFLPFWQLFQKVNLSTFRNVFEAAMYYVPFGYALYALGKRPLWAFVLAFLLADTLEVLQIPIEGRTFDITEGIYAGFASVFGAYALLALARFQVASSHPARGRS